METAARPCIGSGGRTAYFGDARMERDFFRTACNAARVGIEAEHIIKKTELLQGAAAGGIWDSI